MHLEQQSDAPVPFYLYFGKDIVHHFGTFTLALCLWCSALSTASAQHCIQRRLPQSSEHTVLIFDGSRSVRATTPGQRDVRSSICSHHRNISQPRSSR
ncbi:hypothetical protein CF319_g8496 [Tilletia indica]|nr:hypothetical protein CF319_g8496 [Tilletia indica]